LRFHPPGYGQRARFGALGQPRQRADPRFHHP
jgi:hypothetical protein